MNHFWYKINGYGNKIIITEKGTERTLKKFEKIKGLKIKINGNNNYININLDSKNFHRITISLHSSNTQIKINQFKYIENLHITSCFGNNQKLEIGGNCIINGLLVYLNEENAKVKIGDNCLFSDNIKLWATDGHCIINSTTKEVINPIKSGIEIGNNCWLGQSVCLTKNAKLPNNTIVGIGSVVTKQFQKENTIIAGNPSKIIKEGVCWDYRPPAIYQKETSSNLL